MSSILEALKKLEAEKNAPLPQEPLPLDDVPDYGGGSFLADSTDVFPRRRTSIAPLLWVLGGGMFTLMVIGVAVLLVMLLLQAPSGSSGLTAITPEAAPIAAPAVPQSEEPAPAKSVANPDTTALASTDAGASEAAEPVQRATDKPMVVTAVTPSLPTPAPAPVQERPTPEPAPIVAAAPRKPVLPVKINTEPLPLEIRNLPMLSRTQRTQYRLEGIQLNMLNPAGPTRPLGNAFINLEKVFVGEFLPGSNAKLVDVTSHGIAIEIQSTGQRYYIPR